jgi:hypothetical protein
MEQSMPGFETMIHNKHKSAALARATAGLTRVQFDTENPEHLQAFEMLMNGRQHPSLRFELELPYVNVLQMMYDKIGRAYLTKHTRVA